MSSFNVEVVEIKHVEKHPNADSLDIVQIRGFQSVVRIGSFKVGDIAVYIPIDAVLPLELEQRIFPPESKITLSKGRVRAIKIRQVLSQGMVCSFQTLGIGPRNIGEDLAAELGITKFEPEEIPTTKGGRSVSVKTRNPNFAKYTDIERLENFIKAEDQSGPFVDGEAVVVTEKIHGTNFRAGYVPVEVNTIWKKIRKFFHALPEYEFVFGSHRVQLQDGNRLPGKVAYNNVYSKTVKQYGLKYVIPKGYVIYGEIYGDGIQKNYTYGCERNETKMVVFDVMYNGEYLNHIDAYCWALSWGLAFVPVLYTGAYSLNKMKELSQGKSVLSPAQDVREGVVIRPVKERKAYFGRCILKLINEAYLLDKRNSDAH